MLPHSTWPRLLAQLVIMHVLPTLFSHLPFVFEGLRLREEDAGALVLRLREEGAGAGAGLGPEDPDAPHCGLGAGPGAGLQDEAHVFLVAM